MYGSFSIKFYMREAKQPSPKHKIYCRIILDRKKTEFATNIKIERKYWDKDREVTSFSYLNEELADIRMKIYRIKRTLEDENKLYSPRDIVDVLKNRSNEKFKALWFFSNHIEKIQDKGEHASSTVRHYHLAFKYFQKFIKEQLFRDDVFIKEINYELLDKYDYFLKVDVRDKQGNKLGRNHINKQHSILRTVLKECVMQGLIPFNPYRNFMLKDTYVQREALTGDELKRLETDPLNGNLSLDKVRDIFLFSVYTSLRFGDAMALKISDIQDYGMGEPFLKIVMGKTDRVTSVPLIKKALDIVDKYKSDNARAIKGFILPRMSNVKVNLYLKDIALYLHIHKRLTHHIARHTFATHALNLGIPKEVIQSILGHVDMKTTDIYAEMSVARKREEMKKFEK